MEFEGMREGTINGRNNGWCYGAVVHLTEELMKSADCHYYHYGGVADDEQGRSSGSGSMLE